MPPEAVVGVLLAGGQSRRMGGGDKCLRLLGGRTILSRVVARARPQVGALVLNANGDPDRFAAYRLPVAADVVGGHVGPLAGVLTGMEWARAHRPRAPWIATFATDAPFFPDDLVARLAEAAAVAGAPLACARSAGRTHPVFGLWSVALVDDLRAALAAEVRKIDAWTARHGVVPVYFPDYRLDAGDPIDPFFNLNRPEDLAAAQAQLR
jgi:molybdopterin-guanine dinucleotide biosynthesis protein A